MFKFTLFALLCFNLPLIANPAQPANSLAAEQTSWLITAHKACITGYVAGQVGILASMLASIVAMDCENEAVENALEKLQNYSLTCFLISIVGYLGLQSYFWYQYHQDMQKQKIKQEINHEHP